MRLVWRGLHIVNKTLMREHALGAPIRGVTDSAGNRPTHVEFSKSELQLMAQEEGEYGKWVERELIPALSGKT